MSKVNNNSIYFGLKILSILAFSLIFIPFNITRAEGGENYVYYENYNYIGSASDVEKSNPKPTISFISPNSAERGSGSKTITVTGGGFVPGSVAKVNGSNRTTTFVDHSHLLVELTSNDISRSEGFFITVYNSAPGGGYSSAARFSVNAKAVTTSKENTVYSDSRENETSYESSTYKEEENYSSLASNAIFGSDSFLPSGIIQWILFAILILIIVILARKIFGAKEDYDEAPMKHA